VGNVADVGEYNQAVRNSDEPLSTFFKWLFETKLDPENEKGYKAENHKAVLWNRFGKPVLSVFDPDMTRDIFMTKNKLVDKTGLFNEIFEDQISSSLLFQKGDEDWKRKRQACAHAFYKDRLEKMMEVLKEKLSDLVDQWNTEIESSPDGKTVIDMAKVFEELFCRNIVHISFGEDVSEMKIEMDYRKNGRKSTEFVRKTVTLPEAMHEADDAAVEQTVFKAFNPLYRCARWLTGIKNFTRYQATLAANGQRLREAIHTYV
jgi:cytochrome P450